jgi:hypothetical protein
MNRAGIAADISASSDCKIESWLSRSGTNPKNK